MTVELVFFCCQEFSLLQLQNIYMPRPENVSSLPLFPQSDFVIPAVVPFEPIPRDKIVRRLGLTSLPDAMRRDFRHSSWFDIDQGRILFEARNHEFYDKAQSTNRLLVLDFDDNMASATRWHAQEQEKVATNKQLQDRGIPLTKPFTKEVYEMSKIKIPGIVEHEARYTPMMNMILLSEYARMIENGSDEAQAKQLLVSWRDSLVGLVGTLGEDCLQSIAIDPTIKNIFMRNSIRPFVYKNFVSDVIEGAEPHDLIIIATRGEIKGPLSQPHKVHQSGVLEPMGRDGNKVDGVLYSNDTKGEALIKSVRFIENIEEIDLIVYDDNPVEVLSYAEAARKHGFRGMEVVQVEHVGAKRRGADVGIEPDYSMYDPAKLPTNKTNFRHYRIFPRY